MNDHQRFPRVVTTGLIFDSEQRLLLLNSEEWGGKYIIPGGKIHYGETIIEGLKREIREETGLEIKDAEFLFVAESIESPESRKQKHSVYLIHRCRCLDGEVRLNKESQSYVWVTLEDARGLPLSSTSRATIERLLASG
jgi:nucleoside triphosphatase